MDWGSDFYTRTGLPVPKSSLKIIWIRIPNPGVGFTKELSLDLDLKSRHLSLNHAKSVVLDLADFTKQQLLSFD